MRHRRNFYISRLGYLNEDRRINKLNKNQEGVTMTTPQNWTQRELDSVFNRAAEQIESIAREMPHRLHDVRAMIDGDQPVIHFVFASAATAAPESLPPHIRGHKVTHSVKH
jgi:hypothetical protein